MFIYFVACLLTIEMSCCGTPVERLVVLSLVIVLNASICTVCCGYCFAIIKLLCHYIKMYVQFTYHVSIPMIMYCVYVHLCSVM